MFGIKSASEDTGEGTHDFENLARVVAKGLPDGERDRMREAYESLRYSRGHFDDWRAEGEGATIQGRADTWDYEAGSGDIAYAKSDFRVTVPLAKVAVDKLSEHLYKRAPTRKLRDPKVTELLGRIYRRNGMDAGFQELDRLTAVGGFSAVQWAGNDDPRNPIKAHIWGPDQLCVWTDPEDHTQPLAVFRLDKVDGRTRGQLWTRETVGYFTTRRGVHQADATRQFELVGKPKPNPYRDAEGKGIIPFAFAHFHAPVTEFTTDSPGWRLREVNRYLNFGLDDTAEGVRYLSKPIGVAEGVDPQWSAPSVIRPGMFIKLATSKDVVGNGGEARLSYLSADLQWVGVVWSHLNNYLDLSLEMEGIPPSTVRMVLDARSGVSILAEQAPLLGWTERRRRAWLDYESRIATVGLQVLAAHMRANGGRAGELARVEAAIRDLDLQLQWPRLYVDLPGPERDRSDGVRLQWGMASLVDLVMEREGCTEEEAFERLERVKATNDRLRSLGIEPNPMKADSGGFGVFGTPGEDAASTEDVGGGDNPADLDATGAGVTEDADAMSQEGG